MRRSVFISMICLLFAFDLNTRSAQICAGETKAASNTNWEYRVVTSEQIVEMGNKDLTAGLNKLGQEGWELVTINVKSGNHQAANTNANVTFFFKRLVTHRATLQAQLAEAEVEFAIATDKAAWVERLAAKGYMGENQVKAANAKLQKAEANLRKIKQDLEKAPPLVDKAPRQETKLKGLLKQRLDVLTQLWEQTAKAHKSGQASFKELCDAQRIMLTAKLELAESKKEKREIYEDMIRLARELENVARKQMKAGGATMIDLLRAQADRLAVEIALERAMAE